MNNEATQTLPAGERTIPLIAIQPAKNYDADGEFNDNFIRDESYLLSDANYFGCNAESW